MAEPDVRTSAGADRARQEAGYSQPVARGDVAQVVGIVGAPLALLTGLTVKYALIEVWACKSSAGPLVVHLVALATLLLALGAGVLVHRQWPPAGRADPGDAGGREGRTRALAAIGVGVSAICAVVIVGQWLPQLFLSPCQP
ncbi:MAG: hypothetical protein ACXW05_03835 [Gemmatirosa sp.]